MGKVKFTEQILFLLDIMLDNCLKNKILQISCVVNHTGLPNCLLFSAVYLWWIMYLGSWCKALYKYGILLLLLSHSLWKLCRFWTAIVIICVYVYNIIWKLVWLEAIIDWTRSYLGQAKRLLFFMLDELMKCHIYFTLSTL